MADLKYEKYAVRKPVYEVGGGVKNRQSPTMTYISQKQCGAPYYITLGWVYGIPKPNPCVREHVHDYDEILLFYGSDTKNPQVLGGEIEFYIGGQPINFNTTTSMYIPKGTPHGPVTWKKFYYPHMQMSFILVPVTRPKPIAKTSRRAIKNRQRKPRTLIMSSTSSAVRCGRLGRDKRGVRARR